MKESTVAFRIGAFSIPKGPPPCPVAAPSYLSSMLQNDEDFHPRALAEDTGSKDTGMTRQTLHFRPEEDNTRALRDAFGCFGTGVTIITAQTAEGPLGMTANSFSSISLDPALVLWSPAISSKRHDAFVSAPHFCVHILSQQQLKLAQHFASNGTDFSRVPWAPGPSGAPALDGCLAEFHCDTHAVHPAGDHSLILGAVRDVFHHKTEENGLLFHTGRYGHFTPD